VSFRATLHRRAKALGGSVVFAEGWDPRVREAARRVTAKRMARVTVLEQTVSTDDRRLERVASLLQSRAADRVRDDAHALELARDPLRFAAGLVALGEARVAVAGASPQPFVRSSPITHNQLTNNQLQVFADAIISAAHPAGDYRASAEYRKAMAGVLARRALSSLSSSSSLSSFSPERST